MKYYEPCTKCGNIEERDKPNTLNLICFKCKTERRNKYYVDNKERLDEVSRIYREKHTDKIRQRGRERYHELKKLKSKEVQT